MVGSVAVTETFPFVSTVNVSSIVVADHLDDFNTSLSIPAASNALSALFVAFVAETAVDVVVIVTFAPVET